MENSDQAFVQPQTPPAQNTQTQTLPAQSPSSSHKSALKAVLFIVLALAFAAVSGFATYFVINAQFEEKLNKAIAQNKNLAEQVQTLTNQIKSLKEEEKEVSTNNASWVKDWIKEQESSPVANPPALLTKCTYKNETVYYVPPRCCDIGSAVFDYKGEVLCSPDGGITGAGDGKCTDFFEKRTDCVTVWKDSR